MPRIPHRVVRCVLNGRHRSIATIVGWCAMCPAQDVGFNCCSLCANSTAAILDSSRKVFTERLSAIVSPWARMTIRYGEQITSIGLATCGKGGVRLAARLGIQTTRQTILRRIMELPDLAFRSDPLSWERRFFVSAWLPVRHDSGEPGEQAGGGPLRC